jgi:beta-N-acetylhexosaminidase
MNYRKTAAATLLVFTIWSGCAPQRPTILTKEIIDDWVESTLGRLSLDEKVAQMVVPKVFGSYTNTQSDDWKRTVSLVKDRKVGGIAIFAGDVFETAVTINRLQEAADVPLLVSADFERGLAMRTRRATAFPEAMAVAATRDPALAYRMGRVVSLEARALGVHQNLAPVVDINVHPDNPVINVRAYGEDPNWVAEIAASYARGLQEGGVIATAKHFPGHGDVNVDSHVKLPTLDASRGRLDSMEFVPFRRLIAEGVMSVMVGHVALPTVDPSGYPGTLSPIITEELLRQQLGYNGLIVADALEMFGVLGTFSLDEASVRAVEAGIDVLLAPPPGSENTVIEAVKNAVSSGRISRERIDRSVRKILALKKSLRLDEERMVDVGKLSDIIGAPHHWETARAIARASVTAIRNDFVLPLQRLSLKRKILLVVISDNDDYRTEVNRPGVTLATSERVGSYFAVQLRRRYQSVETVRLDPRSNQMEFDSIVVRARTADVIVVPVYVKARSGSGKFGLPKQLIDWASVLAVQGKPTVFIAMGSPYVLGAIKNGSGYLSAYSDSEVSTEAIAEALFGEIPVRGHLPVTIPGMAGLGSRVAIPPSILRSESASSVGFDSVRLSRLDSIMAAAIADSSFPGGQLVVAKDGAVVFNKSFGRLEYSPTAQSVNNQTMYDLASLTKVVATTTATLKLLEEGRLKLDDKVVRYVPEFGRRGKQNITIRHLLLHNAGLPAYKKLYLTVKSAREALDSVFNSELIYPPGDSTVYGDFGYIVLGKVVEQVTGMSLDKYVTETFFRPMGMNRTMFNPAESLRVNIAPTELDAAWRRSLVWGTVHDETAALLGGVSGHAGLFSTASDIATFVQMMLNRGFYGNRNYLKPESYVLASTPPSARSTRTIGWDTKTPVGYSSAGALFGPKSFGHTGFTGTSIWVDPDKNLFVIFLTNRVHSTRENTKIYEIRPAVHDAVMRALNN